MRRAVRWWLVLAGLFVLARLTVPAEAQPISGPYVSLGAGYDLPQNTAATLPAAGFGSGRLRYEQNGGLALSGAAGWALGNGWRFELEGDYDRTRIAALARTPLAGAASGRMATYGVMANAIFDLDIGNRYVFPYLGLGAGYMWTQLSGASVSSGGARWTSGATSGSFAWQAVAGSAFPIPGVPGLSVTAEYRFRDITAGETFTGTPSGAGLKFGPRFDHLFLVGMRYAFDVAPPAPLSGNASGGPAPVAAPAPAPVRSYLVFFDWDSAALTARARAIVAEAAAASQHVQLTQIRVNGYTDASGGRTYNQALSRRRAETVAAQLVRDGVARSSIVIRAYGETHPLVPTAPGAREPQNRRVEIILR
ncbi:MAG: OmpA family protein [Acetobacteraceae bacterium]